MQKTKLHLKRNEAKIEILTNLQGKNEKTTGHVDRVLQKLDKQCPCMMVAKNMILLCGSRALDMKSHFESLFQGRRAKLEIFTRSRGKQINKPSSSSSQVQEAVTGGGGV